MGNGRRDVRRCAWGELHVHMSENEASPCRALAFTCTCEIHGLSLSLPHDEAEE